MEEVIAVASAAGAAASADNRRGDALHVPSPTTVDDNVLFASLPSMNTAPVVEGYPPSFAAGEDATMAAASPALWWSSSKAKTEEEDSNRAGDEPANPTFLSSSSSSPFNIHSTRTNFDSQVPASWTTPSDDDENVRRGEEEERGGTAGNDNNNNSNEKKVQQMGKAAAEAEAAAAAAAVKPVGGVAAAATTTMTATRSADRRMSSVGGVYDETRGAADAAAGGGGGEAPSSNTMTNTAPTPVRDEDEGDARRMTQPSKGLVVSAGPAKPATSAASAAAAAEVIDLIDSDSDGDEQDDAGGGGGGSGGDDDVEDFFLPRSRYTQNGTGMSSHDDDDRRRGDNMRVGPLAHPLKKPRLGGGGANEPPPPPASVSSNHPSVRPLPHPSYKPSGPPPPPPAAAHRHDAPLLPVQKHPPLHHHHHPPPLGRDTAATNSYSNIFAVPQYVSYPAGFEPTWAALMPPPSAALKAPPGPPRRKLYKLSLLNVNQFTITGLSPAFGDPPTPIAGLRVPIRKIARDHGKAVFDKDDPDGDASAHAGATTNQHHRIGGPGRWRIPLGAYHALYAFLVSDPNTSVDGIPNHQLQIASLERARQEKGYPSSEAIAERGVPLRLAKALAPFQRGGVDFVVDKGGRALIADDMGLGKTIQGIASMAVFRDEWPVLVLCPSSARYHWESEFLRWLGAEEDAETDDGAKENVTNTSSNATLSSWQVNVLTNSKSELFPYSDTRIVVCTYGLALSLVQAGKLLPSMFGCAIVDESHMLKNKSSKRSKALVPLLRSIPRCVLLSGTPALARPAELWPQLDVLGVSGRNGFWDDETDFMNKYVRRGGMTEKAELHTMLTGTIMIRRLKHDILKDLPRKVRSQALMHVLNGEQCKEFKGLLAKLRKSKGVLGEFARSHHEELGGKNSEELSSDTMATPQRGATNARVEADVALRAEISHRLHDGRRRIFSSMNTVAINPEARDSLLRRLEGELHYDMDRLYAERSAALDAQLGPLSEQGESEETNRTTLLSHMYGLTGDCKIPLIVDMLRRWLADPTKGKLCIFAHHLSVLNAIRDQAGLSNDKSSRTKFIRIDGATMPRQRQELIKKFQTDPTVRIALLGITAAGVAVTLTASSTVWFAELFWTPALMIQAEDRCHRIGQQARVNCLYFVARGTLDEILWKLIEKKFQDLGEFVEGQEKLKLVVENVFETEKDLHGMFSSPDDNGEDDDHDSAEDETGIGTDLSLADFAEDFALLGQEECAMLQLDSDDEEEGDTAAPKADRKVRPTEVQPSVGQSESDAIILIDDDDDEVKEGPALSEQATGASNAAKDSPAASASSKDRPTNPSLPDCRLYKLLVTSPLLGVELMVHFGRPVVVRITDSRFARERASGTSGKPALGDILVGVNGAPLPMGARIEDVVQFLKSVLSRGPTELTCAESPSFRDRVLAIRQAAILEQERLRHAVERATGPDGVIEIDDDDD